MVLIKSIIAGGDLPGGKGILMINMRALQITLNKTSETVRFEKKFVFMAFLIIICLAVIFIFE